MASLTDGFEIDLLKAITGQSTTILSTTALAHIYIGLTTGSTPTDSTGGTEVATGSYARVDSKTHWAAPSGGSVSTNADLTFPTATADWGAITGFELWDASTTGNRLAWGTVTKTISNGDTATFTSGNLTITLD